MKTPEEIAAERQRVVAEARTWIGTPFHHEARVKGAGVDCAQLIIGVFANVGLIEPFKTAHYPPDWAMHRDEERYLSYVLPLAVEVLPPPERQPLPGDVVLFRYGRSFSHGGIVVEWPHIVHSHINKRVGIDSAKQGGLGFLFENGPNKGKPRPMRLFTYRGWT